MTSYRMERWVPSQEPDRLYNPRVMRKGDKTIEPTEAVHLLNNQDAEIARLRTALAEIKARLGGDAEDTTWVGVRSLWHIANESLAD